MSCLFDQPMNSFVLLGSFEWNAMDAVVLEEYYLPAILDAMYPRNRL